MARIKKARAIERLQKLVDEASELKLVDYRSQKFNKWTEDVYSSFYHIFGEDSRQYSRLPESHSTTPNGIREYLNIMVSLVASNLDDVKAFWEDGNQTPTPIPSETRANEQINTNKVFIVHGRDEGVKDTVARFLEKLGLEPIILAEMPGQGQTIIEKFEQHAQVGFAIVLLTPDDAGLLQGDENELIRPRARQNVIFELGFFIGRLGREYVRALTKGEVEIPSNYVGIEYIPLDASGGWKQKLFQELEDVGFKVDASRAFQT